MRRLAQEQDRQVSREALSGRLGARERDELHAAMNAPQPGHRGSPPRPLPRCRRPCPQVQGGHGRLAPRRGPGLDMGARGPRGRPRAGVPMSSPATPVPSPETVIRHGDPSRDGPICIVLWWVRWFRPVRCRRRRSRPVRCRRRPRPSRSIRAARRVRHERPWVAAAAAGWGSSRVRHERPWVAAIEFTRERHHIKDWVTFCQPSS
jgi:hypothetical protein